MQFSMSSKSFFRQLASRSVRSTRPVADVYKRQQLEGVEAVMITAEGEMLSFRDHQRLTAEEAWSALQSGMSEETAQDVS